LVRNQQRLRRGRIQAIGYKQSGYAAYPASGSRGIPGLKTLGPLRATGRRLTPNWMIPEHVQKPRRDPRWRALGQPATDPCLWSYPHR
jgi:hypothetical protein